MTGPIHEMYDNARRDEMMRQAQQSQIVQNVDHERRTSLVWAWLRRHTPRVVVPDVVAEVVPEAAPEVPVRRILPEAP